MEKSFSVTNIFAQNVFSDSVMRERLPKNIYKKLRHTIDECKPLDPTIAEIVANAMKDWAIEKGATHYTHWFQPLNGVTAEKHDSFISPSLSGTVLMEFSGKELSQGEPDASSFPSGGIRSTFEARGYTVWDPTSPAFIKEDPNGVTFYIPTAFYSYTGEALDKKTPLLRSNQAVSKQALKILKHFGNTSSIRVYANAGPEQEYFLIDKKYFNKRIDLQLTGRTLFGAKPPKGHELDDHYFGSIKERVAEYMYELDKELWKLGVSAKTRHNEVAPNQYELASIYTNVNVATDQNQLVMETMRKVAKHHGLVCLLHPKPFAGINGSGKHNNWSLTTDDGLNLLEPGETPHDNAQFLLFLSAIIKAVDVYADLIRVGAADPGNDHRLGGNEAPPSIISIYLGKQLTEILENIEQGKIQNGNSNEVIKLGVTTLSSLPKDATDRNRTSPFAFTGNKFEFRMPSSSSSVARPNMILNTIIADTLSQFSDTLDKADNLNSAVQKLIQKTYSTHKRIIYNGDGYSSTWIKIAKERNLLNLKTVPDALENFLSDKNISVFKRQKVLSKSEMQARHSVFLDLYCKQNVIEANTMISMASRQILPAVLKYQTSLSQNVLNLKTLELDNETQFALVTKINVLIRKFKSHLNKLEKLTQNLEPEKDDTEKANKIKNNLLPLMTTLRKTGDELETLCDAQIWPLPTYAEMLFDI